MYEMTMHSITIDPETETQYATTFIQGCREWVLLKSAIGAGMKWIASNLINTNLMLKLRRMDREWWINFSGGYWRYRETGIFPSITLPCASNVYFWHTQYSLDVCSNEESAGQLVGWWVGIGYYRITAIQPHRCSVLVCCIVIRTRRRWP